MTTTTDSQDEMTPAEKRENAKPTVSRAEHMRRVNETRRLKSANRQSTLKAMAQDALPSIPVLVSTDCQNVIPGNTVQDKITILSDWCADNCEAPFELDAEGIWRFSLRSDASNFEAAWATRGKQLDTLINKD